MKLAELKAMDKNIQDFLKKTNSVLTITNAKKNPAHDIGWTARLTRNSVQIFLVTGGTVLGANAAASDEITKRRKDLGL